MLHRQLAHACLNLLLRSAPYGLKFNICETRNIVSQANDEVDDLNTCVDQCTFHLLYLLYACRFWDDHLKHTDFKTDLFGKVETFFKEKFLSLAGGP